jgi:hypothetical protein
MSPVRRQFGVGYTALVRPRPGRRLALTAMGIAVCLLSCEVPAVRGQAVQERRPDWDVEAVENWLSAVEAHVPGRLDSPLMSLARVQGDDIAGLWVSIQMLLRFIDNPSIRSVRWPAPPGRDLRGGRVSREIVLTISAEQRQRLGGLSVRVRHLTRATVLMRAVIAHTDLVTLDGAFDAAPSQGVTSSDPIRLMVGDGQAMGLQFVSRHWELAREIVSVLRSTPEEKRFVREWYRATLSFQQWFESFDANHLRAALRAVPDDPVMLFLAGCHHEAFAGPIFQGVADAYRGRYRLDISSPGRELSAAEQFFRRSLALDPGRSEARLRLGRVLVQRGRVDEGIAELNATMGSTTDPVVEYFGALFLGSAHEARGELGIAREWYQRAADSSRGARIPHLSLARIARETGDEAASAESLRRAVAPPAEGLPGEPWWAYRHIQARESLGWLDNARRLVTAGASP